MRISDWSSDVCSSDLEAGPAPAAVHLDTGMARLGLPPAELDILIAEPQRLAGAGMRYLLSHLACADTPDHPLNRRQQQDFANAVARLPNAVACLAASSGDRKSTRLNSSH